VIPTGFFAVLVVVMASVSFYLGPETRAQVAAGTCWLAIAFALVLGLGRSWQREREEGALDGLLTLPVFPSAIFAGKALTLLIFLLCIESVILPLCALLFAVDLARSGPGLVLLALLATPGLACAGTLFGAMTAKTAARDLMLAIVLFPLISPSLLSAVVATRELLGGAAIEELGDFYKLLTTFDLVFLAGGLGLFGALAEN
jgi:heme exporter protein B